MEIFHLFYEKLYSDSLKDSPWGISKFLDNLPLPTLKDRHQDLLEAPFSLEEVLEVIKNAIAIPKEDKGLREVSNYRPISLINNDLKIIKKKY